jgi:hypothetical protein
MIGPNKTDLYPSETNKISSRFPVEESKFRRMEHGSWEFSHAGPASSLDHSLMRRYSLHDPCRRENGRYAAIAPISTPRREILDVRRYSEIEQPTFHELFAPCKSRKFNPFIVALPRRYSIEELKAIGEAGFWDQINWVSWKATMEMGCLDSPAEVFEPPTLRIKPVNEIQTMKLVWPSDSEGEMHLYSPEIPDLNRTTGSGSVISLSDEEDLYSAEDREPRCRNHLVVTPATFSESFEIEHIEHSAISDTTAASSLLRNRHLTVSPTNSNIESLNTYAQLQVKLDVPSQLEKWRYDMEIERSTSERVKRWLERNLKESEGMSYWRRFRSMQDYTQQLEVMQLSHKLKRENVKLARSKKGLKEIREYSVQSIDARDMRYDAQGFHDENSRLRASYQKLEKAHEIAQEAYKVLESRLQKADSDLYEMQQKLNEQQ